MRGIWRALYLGVPGSVIASEPEEMVAMSWGESGCATATPPGGVRLILRERLNGSSVASSSEV